MRPTAAFLLALLVLLLFAFLSFGLPPAITTAVSPEKTPQPLPTLTGRVATEAELELARREWEQSEHAATFDEGMGANTTCARCKSPMNWDPSQSEAQEMALDCGSCKRVPGEERPVLSGGVPVAEADWQHINCEICHVPVGDSYDVGIAFWNQALGRYEHVDSVSQLCAHCHEGQHGFRVIEEQAISEAHTGWECTRCHGSHGSPSSCTDCHNPEEGPGATEHARHPSVNCTGCHDDGGLSIWYDEEPGSSNYGEYVTLRFAHTLTSWPSHNLSTDVYCQRCHHPVEQRGSTVVPEVSCTACHEHRDGAVSLWCDYFPRNTNPLAAESQEAAQE